MHPLNLPLRGVYWRSDGHAWADPRSPPSREELERKRRIKMFGKPKGSARGQNEELPAAPQLQDLTPGDLAESDSTEASSIGHGMAVVGKISTEGALNVF